MGFPSLLKNKNTSASSSKRQLRSDYSMDSSLTTTTTTSSSSSSSLDDDFDAFFEMCSSDNESVNVVIRGLKKSDRLFFEPTTRTSSIMDEFKDMRRKLKVSMKEMVVRQGLEDWGRLNELLECYLKANEKKKHGVIVETYVSLLLELMSSSSSPFCFNS